MTTKSRQITILALVATSVAGDSRVLREASALVHVGYIVKIIGKDVPEDFRPPTGIQVFSATSGQGLRPTSMKSLTTKRLAPHLRALRWMLLPSHRAKSFATWADSAYRIANDLEFDVVHAHDFTALQIGARLAKERDIDFIYDSHEWWSGRQRQYRPTPITDWREAIQEGKLARQASAVITVGDAIADLMRSKRNCKKVFVIRNSFPRSSNTSELVVSPPKGILYAGRIDAYRELEVTIQVARKIPIPIYWMGSHDNQWSTKWVPQARSVGIEVLASQQLSAVTTAMQNAGLVFVTHSNRFESHRLAMPNKLFHAVHAGVPVIATNVSELATIVRKYDLGELYEPGNAESMFAAIGRATDRHPQLLRSVDAAKEELSWERDEKILRGIYEEVLQVLT